MFRAEVTGGYPCCQVLPPVRPFEKNRPPVSIQADLVRLSVKGGRDARISNRAENVCEFPSGSCSLFSFSRWIRLLLDEFVIHGLVDLHWPAARVSEEFSIGTPAWSFQSGRPCLTCINVPAAMVCSNSYDRISVMATTSIDRRHV